MPRILAALLVALLVFAAPATAAYAGVDDFEFESFTGDYYLSRDTTGTAQLYVVETLVALFPDTDQNRGIVRAVPRTQAGIDLETEIVDVTGADGAVIPWWTERDDDWIYVFTGDDTYVHGAQTYTLSYTMSDVVIRYPDTDADEFYWDTVGTDHPQPVGEVTIGVHLTGSVAADLKDGSASCYEGPENSTTACAISGPRPSDHWPSAVSSWAAWHGASVAGAQSFSVGTGPLAAGEDVTVALGFTPGSFAAASPPPPPPFPWWELILPVAGLLFGILGIPIMLAVRARLRRNPDAGPVVVRYERAEESLATSASVLDAPNRALAAQTVDLAVRDKIEIHASGDRDDPDDFVLALVDTAGLDEDDLRVVTALFGKDAAPGARTSLGSFAERPPRRAIDYLRLVATDAQRRGYRVESPAWVRSLRRFLYYGAMAAAAVLIVFFADLTGLRDAGVLWLPVVAIVACFVTVVSIAVLPVPALTLTVAGGEHVHELEGIRQYLELAEEDRLRAAQAPQTADLVSSGRRAFGDDAPGTVVNVYERLLPYAVLFGLEREWASVIRAELPADRVASHSAVLDLAHSHALDRASSSISRLAATSVSRSGGSSSGRSSSGGISRSGGSSGRGFSSGGGGGGRTRGR